MTFDELRDKHAEVECEIKNALSNWRIRKMTSTSGSNLPEDLLAHLNKQLEDGEVVVWAGQSSSAAL